ncbi:c-type cytochrome [Achromobacter arsenitoxydans]|uniref:Putative cytochrome c n=1 Tax=Achromobacter arsenitoxydans SY8 TaxID=477184 RepID=H0F4P3_9BURK|nr:c-type cytochrome [Achromobacter arsenitoxydans]EHK66694.1 putative cytochrome c [Achromobacter arsenitoxydans SY8]
MCRIARPYRLLPALTAMVLLGACHDDRAPLFAMDRAGGARLQGDPERGRQLIAERGCIACHAVPGVSGPSSRVGPPLGNMARQAYVAGLLPNTPQNLVRWLMDPPAVNPRTAMPDTGLQLADAEDIAAYLLRNAGAREKAQ